MHGRRSLPIAVFGILLVAGSGGDLAAGNPIATQGPKPPTNTALPTISGTPMVGQRLTGSPGKWTGPPASYAYQWERCDLSGRNCNGITGATATTYVLTLNDLATTTRLAVMAASKSGTTAAVSNPTAPVQSPTTSSTSTTTTTTTTTSTSAPVFNGLASLMSSLTCGNPDTESPQIWGGLGFIASDGSTCDVQLVSDSRYGKAYRYRVGDASYAPFYDPGPNKGVADLTIIRPPHLGQWDWYAMAIKLDPSWQQPTWSLFFEPMFPRYTTPPEQIASAYRYSPTGDYCYSYSQCDKSTVWWLFSRLVGNLSNLQRQDVWLQPAELGKWTEFAFGIKWALDTTGAYKVYTRVPADGQTSFTLRASATGIVTYQTDGNAIPSNLTDIMALYEGNEPSNGWPALPTNIAYHTGFRRYNDEASALAAFGG